MHILCVDVCVRGWCKHMCRRAYTRLYLGYCCMATYAKMYMGTCVDMCVLIWAGMGMGTCLDASKGVSQDICFDMHAELLTCE